MLEFKDWKSGETENEYLHGTKIAYVSLGEESYGLIVVTPRQRIHIEEIPQYGGEPRYYCRWHGTVEEAVKFIKETFT